jgi:hypothetical protein
MQEIVAQLIALISDADQAIEKIDSLQAGLEQVINESGVVVLAGDIGVGMEGVTSVVIPPLIMVSRSRGFATSTAR